MRDRGTSELHRAGCRFKPRSIICARHRPGGRGHIPGLRTAPQRTYRPTTCFGPKGPPEGGQTGGGVRVKRCGKSAPRAGRPARQGKPLLKQGQSCATDGPSSPFGGGAEWAATDKWSSRLRKGPDRIRGTVRGLKGFGPVTGTGTQNTLGHTVASLGIRPPRLCKRRAQRRFC